MRNTIYRQMVYWINHNRTWIEVADAYMYKEQVATRNGRTTCIVGRTLVLRAFRAYNGYKVGQTWDIPDHELDRALAVCRKADRAFKLRIKKGGSYLTVKDTETIIRTATHGVIRLELTEEPVYIHY